MSWQPVVGAGVHVGGHERSIAAGDDETERRGTGSVASSTHPYARGPSVRVADAGQVHSVSPGQSARMDPAGHDGRERQPLDQAANLRRLMRAAEGHTSVIARDGGRSSLISVGPSAGAQRGAAVEDLEPSDVRRPRRVARIRLARAIAVTSGKGGVGKTNIAVNLSIALAHQRRVCLLDADLGMANVDVLCGLSPRATLEDVIQHGRRIEDVMVLAPGGFRLVPGASGVASVANLGPEARRRLLAQLAALERHADMLVIDTAAGIASNSIAFAAAAHTVLVAVTPEPTSITDAYGAVKTIASKVRQPRIRLIVNMANDREEGEEVFRRIDRVSRTFLDLPLELGGIIPFDPAVRACVRRREPVLLSEPDCPASRAIRAIARSILTIDESERAALAAGRGAVPTNPLAGTPPVHPAAPNGVDPAAFAEAREGFLSRLVGWLRRS